MAGLLYTTTGCVRCAVVKKYLQQNGIVYEEQDVLDDGKERFVAFYRSHYAVLRRKTEGIEFPIWAEGGKVRQGLGAVIAHLYAGERLSGFISRDETGKGCLGGLRVSNGDPPGRLTWF